MVREFYTSYAATVHNTLPKEKKPLAQPKLTNMRVRGQQVDILETSIRRMLFGPAFSTPRSTPEFDYRVGQMRDLLVMRDTVRRASLMSWVAGAEQGPKVVWVTTYLEPIVKALHSFPAKFWWAVQSRIRPTLVDNTLMMEHAVLVASILASYNIDCARLKVEQIQEDALKRSTSIPFSCLI